MQNKETIKIMKAIADREKKKNYRITIIFKDQIIVERFYREEIAKKTVADMKVLCPELFVSGAVEEKRGIWKVIRTKN